MRIFLVYTTQWHNCFVWATRVLHNRAMWLGVSSVDWAKYRVIVCVAQLPLINSAILELNPVIYTVPFLVHTTGVLCLLAHDFHVIEKHNLMVQSVAHQN